MPDTLGVLKHDDSAVRKETNNRHNSRMLGATQLGNKKRAGYMIGTVYIFVYSI